MRRILSSKSFSEAPINRRQFANAANILIERVEAYVIDDTAFLPKHMREALPLLEKDGSVRIED